MVVVPAIVFRTSLPPVGGLYIKSDEPQPHEPLSPTPYMN